MKSNNLYIIYKRKRIMKVKTQLQGACADPVGRRSSAVGLFPLFKVLDCFLFVLFNLLLKLIKGGKSFLAPQKLIKINAQAR